MKGMDIGVVRRSRGVTAVCLLVLCLGCTGGQSFVKGPETKEEIKAPAPPRVALGPGDVLEIKFFFNQELNDTQTVRPDGKISLLLVGEVEVKGKTPGEVRDELTKLYGPELRTPAITVIVRSLFDRRIYVGGEVKTPGLIQMPGPMTALEAIMQAGGFDARTAEKRNVVIIRHKDGRRYGCALDLSGALKGEEGKPFYLEPQDIVYVPRTVIAQVNQWIDQYITKIIPRSGLSLLYPLGAGAIGLDTSATVFVP